MNSKPQDTLPDGVYAMLVTPFDKNEQIDFGALAAEVRWCIQQGAAGIVVTPSIGEFACLTNEERWKCFEACFQTAREHAPAGFRTVAMTGATCTREMVQHAEVARKIGYDAAQLIAPYYWVPDEEEVFDYYRAAVATGLPVVVYHNPRLSKFKMSRAFLGRLARLEGVVAIKEVETDRHVELEPLFRQVEGTGVKIFTTFRAFLDGYLLGSAGGFINVFALPGCLKLWEVLRSGDYRRGSALQTMINEAFPRGGEDNKKHIGTTKMSASVVTGINMGAPRSPYRLPSPEFEERLRAFLPTLQEMLSD
ncbi:MAG: dihydrodipicolinate synthase family protein [Acidobacteria bacterium]|nr:dihydrodipicolinate synthase family protein [Acidobacteriota bacterium]